jgi:DMSO/TMAO reductase YedYZ molybdopterin-dependent catalytic subunit/mono/diheme cytochrome c family protein
LKDPFLSPSLLPIMTLITTLTMTAALGAGVALGAELLREQVSRPLDAEATMEAMSPWETPIEGFFVRSHFDVPVVHRESWSVAIDGLVEHPMTLTLPELEALGVKSEHAVLECSGNGRGQQVPHVPGIQWQRGGVGNAAWSGVPLKVVLAKAGLKQGARFVTVSGADHPALPSMPGFIRSIPLGKALSDDTLLATMMDGKPMPVLHGGPLRLILPNWYGENWMKWVIHLTVAAEEDHGFYMKKAYRTPKQPVKPGERWDSTAGVPVEQLRVQALVVSPMEGDVVPAGPLKVSGKTFSGAGDIVKVEVSGDGGKTWMPASVEPRHPDGGWQEFSGTVDAKAPVSLVVGARATDAAGNVQPMTHTWNPSGYLRNAVDLVTVIVGSKASEAGSLVLEERCTICHNREMIEQQRLTEAQWQATIEKMVKVYGAKLTDGEAASLLAYVSRFSPDVPARRPEPESYGRVASEAGELPQLPEGHADRGGELFHERCVACHGKDGQGDIGPRLKGWALGKDEFEVVVTYGRAMMPAFGGQLTEQDMADLHRYLME